MNITKPQLCRNRHRCPVHLDKLCIFCVYAGLLLLFVCIVPLVLNAEETEIDTSTPSSNSVASATENSAQEAKGTGNANGASADIDSSTTEPTTETITGTSKRMERFEKEGITILIDEAKTVRYDKQGVEIGFLNADKITLKTDPKTRTTTEIIAEGNVEIRDQDIFATCDRAVMNNLTNTIVLTDNVVVLQNKDRLETKIFTFNRSTGKQTGEGGVKFKVTVTQAAPREAGEDTDGGESTDVEGASTDTPDQPDQTDAKTETSDTDDTTEEAHGVDTQNAEGTNSEDGTDTDTEALDDADANPETEAPENH